MASSAMSPPMSFWVRATDSTASRSLPTTSSFWLMEFSLTPRNVNHAVERRPALDALLDTAGEPHDERDRYAADGLPLELAALQRSAWLPVVAAQEHAVIAQLETDERVRVGGPGVVPDDHHVAGQDDAVGLESATNQAR